MEGAPFLVVDRAYCMWDGDLTRRNLSFVESIDPAYFEYLATTHIEKVECDERHYAAMSMRSGYHHALETFFMLLGASIQAPECVVGWFQKCQPRHLREILNALDVGDRLLNRLGLERVSWADVASRVLLFSYDDEAKLEKTRELFSILWRRFGSDFQNHLHTREYNCAKHGLRIRPGGFELRFGLEETPGIPAALENMSSLGSSRWGSTFHEAAPIDGSPAGKRDPHFRVKEHSLNWDVENVAHGLMMLALSIRNLQSFLKIRGGVDPATVQFTRPQDDDHFEKPWAKHAGALSCGFHENIRESDIRRLSEDEMKQHLARSALRPVEGEDSGVLQSSPTPE